MRDASDSPSEIKCEWYVCKANNGNEKKLKPI
jgi:hypothetical protein